MEDKVNKSSSLINNLFNILKQRKKTFLSILILLVLVLLSINILKIYQDGKNKKTAEKFIQAGLFLTSKDNDKAKSIYKDIILDKNKFYSHLALSALIENKLEENKDEVLKLYDVVQKIKLDKEEKNLIKLKKALFLIKLSKNKEGKKLLKEIVDDNSTWSNIALEILNL